MAMNIYQKTKLIMLKSGKCTAIYNKLAKILIESNDQDLNCLIEQMRELLKTGRIGNGREEFYRLNGEIIIYCDSKIETKKDLKLELKALIEDYKTKLNNVHNYSKEVGYEDMIKETILDLENLLK